MLRNFLSWICIVVGFLISMIFGNLINSKYEWVWLIVGVLIMLMALFIPEEKNGKEM